MTTTAPAVIHNWPPAGDVSALRADHPDCIEPRALFMDAWASHRGYHPHPAQLQLHAMYQRHRLLRAGRRGGKTTAVSFEAEVESQLWGGSIGEADIGITAPTDAKLKIVYGMIHDSLMTQRRLGRSQIRRAVFSSQEKLIELAWGARIIAQSWKSGLPLEGLGLRLLIVDECQELPEDVWWESLAPTLLDHGGRTILSGKAKGVFFRKRHRRAAQAPLRYGIVSFPSWDNPVVPPAEIEEWREDMPGWLFGQEVEGSFQDLGDLVFAGFEDCVDPDLRITFEDAEEYGKWVKDNVFAGADPGGRSFVDGWDFAKHVDETVGITMDRTDRPFRVVEVWGSTKRPWPVFQEAVVQRQAKWDSEVWPDTTGVGDAVADNLAVPLGVVCNGGRGYVFTGGQNGTKMKLLTNLQRLIEKREVVLPNHPRLLRQLEEYRWDDAGLATDYVMALGLACMGCTRPGRPGGMLI